jgi:ribosomal protein S18 acetylase RimI-like enzyme
MIEVHSSTSLTTGLSVRPATLADQQQIADLIFFEQRVHRHLDWRTPLEWLGQKPYLVLEKNEHVFAALACPPEPPSVAWIRLFAYDVSLSGQQAWSPLWDAARRELASVGAAHASAIATHHWIEAILIESGFELFQQIVMLEWNQQTLSSDPVPARIILRPMTTGDLPDVAEVDAAAFEPLWQNSLFVLSKAFLQSAYSSAAEQDGRMLGYQLSTGSPFGAHLARLAVRPEAQGMGIASALVRDLVQHISGAAESPRITVNTQADNAASLALYRKIGFRRTGEQYPVYVFRVE